jgi:hypothetical protein
MSDSEILGLKWEHTSCMILLFILDTQQYLHVENALLFGILHALSGDTVICCEQFRNEVGEKCIKELE